MMDARHAMGGKPKVDFDQVRISIASPEKILSWSWGEVTRPETINYRTFKPEKDGLFCAKIFGPINDFECLCGKYKRMKYRGIICERCGVEVTRSNVRRERMGHIKLASPVAHIWFFKGTPSRIGLILDLSIKDLEKVLYFESYIITNPGETPLKERQLLTEEEFKAAQEKFGDTFDASIGAEAIKKLLEGSDTNKEAERLRELMKTETSQQRKLRHAKRLRVFKALKKSGNRPEWMILDVVPVIPPDLRPLVRLDGGRFATSDLNDLYRRVINRNNRLKKLMELRAPELIIRNEKRMLQEAVDALFDNGKRGRVHLGANRRPLKSLSEALRGKQGRFRQNLLGKRVDYSGRSVIVVGPELKLNQCGLPKKMALELFKPFIFHKLEKEGLVPSVKIAREWHEQERAEVWDYLEEVVKEHPILLNRAPTLHRLGIQAFEPILVEGKAIQIHPLVCAAFNADFDGDQMAVHVPLSVEAQVESKTLMLATQNILSPANGRPLAIPSQDMVLGCYYLTLLRKKCKGEGRLFASMDEVLLAMEDKQIDLHAEIKVRYTGKFINLDTFYDDQAVMSCPVSDIDNGIVATSPGRIIFNNILPERLPFINGMFKKKGMENLVYFTYLKVGLDNTIEVLDSMKTLGFNYATYAGFSLGIDDFIIPEEKKALVAKAHKNVQREEQLYKEGVISARERFNRVVEIWGTTTDKVSSAMIERMRQVSFEGHDLNPLFVMADSGSRGNKQQIRQLAGMRGLMSKPSGEILETPIISNLREGLNVLQYFISTHGARKGLADTALKTANSGYLTRKLVDVAQEVIVDEFDCGTLKGVNVGAIVENGELIEPFVDRVVGRFSLEKVKHPDTNKVIVDVNEEITENISQNLENLGIERIKIRSVLTCESKRGVCQLCYGRDMAKGNMVELREAVGVQAAQSIGEPGTQLTMRTFHVGGIAMGSADRSKLEAKNDGVIKFNSLNSVTNKEGQLVVVNRNANIAILDHRGREIEHYPVPYGAKVMAKDGEEVKARQEFAEWDPFNTFIMSEETGVVKFHDVVLGMTLEEVQDEFTGLITPVITDPKDEKMQPQVQILDTKKDDKGKSVSLRKYYLPSGANLEVKDNDKVHAGAVLAKIPREAARTKDITGGLPRAEELFEARRPKHPAVISEIDGLVKFGGLVRGNRKLTVHNERGGEKEYFVPKEAHLIVAEGERVRAGTPLMDGPVNPHDILKVLGEKELAEYLVREIQEVYRLQGVAINDKHIETIIRQMLRWLKVEEVGDTELLVDEQVDKFIFQEENEKIIKGGGKPAKARPLLLGITKSALSTESFIAAASFQETTRVLTEASLYGKVDHLRRLKENIIMGRLIPAGTGYKFYRDVELKEDKEEEKIEEISLQLDS
ncbi:MAG: DNA-directed RNA polymerase subunit beta' [Candidatus Aminicenantes bacterium]|nr:DNA-directed RNA polymerase subunit beta' [Candidatus Aminicenantes bacterium]